MSAVVLSPWPGTTVPAQRTSAVACLKEVVDENLSDDRANSLGEISSVLVENYAPDAAQPVKNESVLRCAGWLYQAQPGLRDERLGEHQVSYSPGMQGALRHSGAMALLSPFKTRYAGLSGDYSD